jgi:N-acetylmuramoyl-L-alanine amidase
VGVTLALGSLLQGQTAPPRSASPYVVLSKDGRQALPVSVSGGSEVVSLADLAAIFDLTVREDTLAGGITVDRGGRTLVLSPGQGLASASGRLVSLPAAPVRSGSTWLVPLEFVNRALPLVSDVRVELRPSSRLVIVGDLRVPRVAVRTERLGELARLTFDITPRTSYAVTTDAGRLVVRFDCDLLDARIEPPSVPELVRSVTVVEPSTAIAIELGARYASYRASEVPVEPDVTQLVVDVLADGASSPPAPTPTAPEPPPVLFDQPASAIRTVVIDPGHGGDEEGARGPGGALEKDVALAVARQLRAAIENRLGIRVLLTRDGDQTVPLDERAAIANNNKADLFISLHANASVRASARGAEVFYLSIDEYGPEARRIAEAEGTWLPAVGGGSRQVEMILWDMAQVRHLEDSAVFAGLVEQALRSRIPMSARAIQQAPFRVLVGANMPAALVEMGFISHPDEERLLTSSAHQSLIVQALFESVVRFRTWIENGRRAPDPGPEGSR